MNCTKGINKKISKFCFRNLWMFDGLLEENLKRIDSFCNCKQYSPGQAVFLQGDIAEKMFLIKAGRIKLSKILNDGREIILDFRKENDILGENMLSGEQNYPVSAWAVEKTLICDFSNHEFKKLITHHPEIGFKIIQNMSIKIVSLTDRLGNIGVNSLEDRLYKILKNIAEGCAQGHSEKLAIQFPLTHEELGFLIGVHRVSVTRAMKTLTESGKIIRQGRSIIIP